MAARAAPGLLRGSALDPTAYEALLDGQEAAMVFTEPPYKVPIDGPAMRKDSIRHR